MRASVHVCLFATGVKKRKQKISLCLFFAFGKNEFKTPRISLEVGPGTSQEGSIDIPAIMLKIDS